MLEKLKALFASAPKTLPQANETLTAANAELTALAAELEGRDAKIADLTNELAEAEKEGEQATAKLALAQASIAEHVAERAVCNELFTAIGLADIASTTAATDIKAKFDSHVSKQTTLALAKTGHPPAHVPAVDVTPIDDITTKSDPDKAAVVSFDQYLALIDADNKAGTKESAQAKTDFYAKNHAAIARGMSLRKRS